MKPDLTRMEALALDEASELRHVIRDAVERLEQIECTFWACNGPDVVEDMITCSICCLIHDLREALRVPAATS